jgi:hypothetical protein
MIETRVPFVPSSPNIHPMDIAKLRAYWFHKQGLDGSIRDAKPAEVFEGVGWARSVGGANPYITLFSRAGTAKSEAEQAVAQTHIHELPSARNCTYVVPERDFAVALRMARGTGDTAELSVAKKWLGVTDAEIENLESKVLDALTKGPLDPKEIKDAVGNAVRSLGEEGKKRGQTTTLPIALGILQTEGHIRRIPVGGRLDQQRYKYTRWDPSPMEGYTRSLEETYVDFALRYFHWIGPATKASYQGISGQGVRAAEATLSQLDLVPFEDGSEFIMRSEDKKAFDAFQAPKEPQYALVSCLDGISHLQWTFKNLVEEADKDRQVFGPKGLVPLGGLSDLESHAIYDRGRLVGLWEFDSFKSKIAWTSFVEPTAELKNAISEMEEFGRELGDIRSFSLDSPESRKPRVEALRNGN